MYTHKIDNGLIRITTLSGVKLNRIDSRILLLSYSSHGLVASNTTSKNTRRGCLLHFGLPYITQEHGFTCGNYNYDNLKLNVQGIVKSLFSYVPFLTAYFPSVAFNVTVCKAVEG